jgi:hypothetical protein
VQFDECLYGTVIGSLNFRREKTGWYFTVLSMVMQALAALEFLTTGFIGAVAIFFIPFHGTFSHIKPQ